MRGRLLVGVAGWELGGWVWFHLFFNYPPGESPMVQKTSRERSQNVLTETLNMSSRVA